MAAPVLRENPRVKYALIAEFTDKYSVVLMCRMLEVSRSGYYRWLGADKSARDTRYEEMEVLIKDRYETFEAAYGAPRLTLELNAMGHPCSLNYVANIMKTNGIVALNCKAFNYGSHALTMHNVAENLLWRDFTADQSNQKWVTDITYIWVERRWMCLATVMDLFSRRIVGWSFDKTMTEELITSAMDMAIATRKPKAGLIVHSDLRVQYRANSYVDYLERHGFKRSMSRKGNCWDNAAMESFFSRLKVELFYPRNYQTVEEARTGIFTYIEIFYNRTRRHSANGGFSPMDFENNAAMAA